MELVVAHGTALFASDVEALRGFTGRYDGHAENGVQLASIVRLTVAQHTQYRLFGRPKVESQTVEQAATDGGDWSADGPDDAPDDDEAGADGDVEVVAFRQFLGSLVHEPRSVAVEATVAARAQTLLTLFATLRAGRTPATADAFDTARDVAIMVCEATVAGGRRHAAVVAAEEEERQQAAMVAAAEEAAAAAAEAAEVAAIAAAAEAAARSASASAAATDEDRAVSRWAGNLQRG
jgi:hypothetical protein